MKYSVIIALALMIFSCEKEDSKKEETAANPEPAATVETVEETEEVVTPAAEVLEELKIDTSTPVTSIAISWVKSEALQLLDTQITEHTRFVPMKDETILLSSGAGYGWYHEKDSEFWETSPEFEIAENTSSHLLTNLSQWTFSQSKVDFSFIGDDGITRKELSYDFTGILDSGATKVIYLAESKAAIVEDDGMLLFQVNEGKMTYKQLPWPPTEGLQEGEKLIGLADGSHESQFLFLTDKSIHQLKKYTVEDKDIWLWSKAIEFQNQDIDGDIIGFYLKLDDAFQADESSRLVTTDAMYAFSSESKVVDDSINNTTQVTWEKDIAALADKYCYVCHKPGSGRNWEEGKSKASWIQKAVGIKNSISGGSMPPPSDQTGKDITAQEKALFLKWLDGDKQ